MNTDFTIEFCGDYLHIRHADGYEINPKTAAKLWSALIEACKHYNCNRVFREGSGIKLKMRMIDTLSAAKLATEGIRGLRVACCFENFGKDEMTEFFKTAALNRGIRIEFFTDRAEAFRWLGIEPAQK